MASKPWRSVALAAAMVIPSAPLALAQEDPATFFAGKTVELFVGFSSGGGYDNYTRLLARHLGKHISGKPEVIVRNMPGAGSLTLSNWLYSAAPKDGTAMGMIARGTPFDPLLGVDQAQFDPQKFNWIGSMNDEVSVCVAWKGSAVDSFQGLFQKELVVGGTGPSADTDQFPKVLNGVLGTQLKVISGYPGGNDINLAMERGEVQGRCGWSWSSVVSTKQRWLDNGSIKVLAQLALAKHPSLPNVPLVMDFAKTEEQKRMLQVVFARQVIGRPIVAPPDILAGRVQALRDAFMAAMHDPALKAEAALADMELNPVSGERVQALIGDTYATPKPVAQKIAKLLD